jgi:transcriptional regulator with XRE-family HTH domain
MSSALKQFRARALARPDVKKAYEALDDEFALLDEVLRARAEAGLTQAEVAARAGTTQSAIARLESSAARHSPSIATLRKYASALGYRVQIRLVKNKHPQAAQPAGRGGTGPRRSTSKARRVDRKTAIRRLRN